MTGQRTKNRLSAQRGSDTQAAAGVTIRPQGCHFSGGQDAVTSDEVLRFAALVKGPLASVPTWHLGRC